MFGLFQPKLPVTPEQQQWIDTSFLRLASLLGKNRLLQATAIVPTDEHFPDHYDKSENALHRMFHRVATQMQVNPDEVDLTLFENEHDLTRELVPFYSGQSSGAAGLYHHDADSRPHISISHTQLKDPMSLVATLSHEISHIILLRPGLVGRDDLHMEPLTDLLTVFLGFGIFTANSAFRFRQFDHYDKQGWSAKRLGYLSEQQFGYALARFAFEREEQKPAWSRHLASNISPHMKRSLDWLITNRTPRIFA